MYLDPSRDLRPAWHRDAKWLSGLLLIVSLAATLVVFSISQVTEEQPAQEVLQTVLTFTLFPDGLEQSTPLNSFRQGADFRPGEPYQPLPGINITVQPDQLEALDAEQVMQRTAQDLTGTLIREGATSLSERIADPQLRAQVEAGLQGPVRDALQSFLEAEMLPSGLEDGSRLANWRGQSAYARRQPVQPVVGVFVRLDPARLESAAPRDIGVMVIEALTDTVLTEGLPDAQALVTNTNLNERLTSAVETSGRDFLEGFISTLLVPYEDTITERLERVRAVQAQPATDEVLPGLNLAETSGNLSPQEANFQVIQQLSSLMYEGGTAAVTQVATNPQLAIRLQTALEPFQVFTRAQHQRLTGLTWLLGGVTFVMLVLLLFFSAGLARLSNVGLAFVFASLLGVVVLLPLRSAMQAAPTPVMPQDMHAEGVINYSVHLLAYVGTSFPLSLVEAVVRNHLIVMSVGIGLILLSLLILLVRTFRPRRSRL